MKTSMKLSILFSTLIWVLHTLACSSPGATQKPSHRKVTPPTAKEGKKAAQEKVTTQNNSNSNTSEKNTTQNKEEKSKETSSTEISSDKPSSQSTIQTVNQNEDTRLLYSGAIFVPKKHVIDFKNVTQASPKITSAISPKLALIKNEETKIISPEINTNGVYLSAPLFPDIKYMQQWDGGGYDHANKEEWISEKIYSFDFIRDSCIELDYDIKVQDNNNNNLTTDELNDNYLQVADCAYSNFTSKPYFVPQLMADKDICKEKLGSEWRLPTENDIYNLSDYFYHEVVTTLYNTAGSNLSRFANAYFSLAIFVKGNDDTIKVASLYPGKPDNMADRVNTILLDSNTTQSGCGSKFGTKCLLLYSDVFLGEEKYCLTSNVVVRCIKGFEVVEPENSHVDFTRNLDSLCKSKGTTSL